MSWGDRDKGGSAHHSLEKEKAKQLKAGWPGRAFWVEQIAEGKPGGGQGSSDGSVGMVRM